MLSAKLRAACGLAVMAAVFVCGFGTAPGAVTVPHAVASPMNPHLHVPAVTKVTVAPGTHQPTVSGTGVHVVVRPAVQLTHQAWAPRIDTHTYIAEHRGLATIRGQIRNAAGQPVNDVRVALRKPGGRVIPNVALRHITHTGTNGEFVMVNVRPGTYRVFASIAKRKAFVKEAVGANSVEHVSLKI